MDDLASQCDGRCTSEGLGGGPGIAGDLDGRTYELPELPEGGCWAIEPSGVLEPGWAKAVARPAYLPRDLGHLLNCVLEGLPARDPMAGMRLLKGRHFFVCDTDPAHACLARFFAATRWHVVPRDHAFAASELADMLERGTSRERSWALDALRSPSQPLRDAVALRDAITRCAAPVRTSPAQAAEHVGTLVASLWVLEGSYVMRDVGISPGKGPPLPAPTWWPGAIEEEAAWLDDTQVEVLLRSVEHGGLEQVTATMRRLDAGVTTAVDVPGGCFTLTYVARSENGRFLTVEIAYRERDAKGLKYIPHARVTGHDRGTLLLRPSQRIDGPSDAPAPGRMLMLSLEHVPVGEAIDLEAGAHGAAR